MKDFEILIAATTSIILFIFGLENFSKEIQKITGERFRKFLGRATKYPILGVLIGAVVTAFIQSSSATSVIAISLVNAGVLSFKNSVGIIFGSNIGTTVTAQLVAFKLTSFAPAFIILGFGLSFIRTRFSVFGKSLFYFGFVFFTLNLISATLSPLQNDERLVGFLTANHGPMVGIFIGFIITAIVQSSSVTTGLAIIFTQQGLMSLDNAIPVLMGANVGTTVTALIPILHMDTAAKKTALSHFFFNVGGVILFMPTIWYFKNKLPLYSDDPAISLANFHLIFNLLTSFVFILFVHPFTKLIDKLLGEGKMDFEHLDLELFKKPDNFDDIEKGLTANIEKAYQFVQENYNLITLSIETNYRSIYDAAKKRIEYLDFVKSELLGFFSQYIAKSESDEQIDILVKIMARYEYIFQIHDSTKDFMAIKDSMDLNYIELKSDLLLMVRELSGKTISFFDEMARKDVDRNEKKRLKKEAKDLQEDLEKLNKELLILMANPDRQDAGLLLQMITYSQRLKDKLVNYHNLVSGHHHKKEELIQIEPLENSI